MKSEKSFNNLLKFSLVLMTFLTIASIDVQAQSRSSSVNRGGGKDRICKGGWAGCGADIVGLGKPTRIWLCKQAGGLINTLSGWMDNRNACAERRPKATPVAVTKPTCSLAGQRAASNHIYYQKPDGSCGARPAPPIVSRPPAPPVHARRNAGATKRRQQAPPAPAAPSATVARTATPTETPVSSEQLRCNEQLAAAEENLNQAKNSALNQCQVLSEQKNEFGNGANSMGSLSGANNVIQNCALAVDTLFPIERSVRQSTEICTTQKQQCETFQGQMTNLINSCAASYAEGANAPVLQRLRTVAQEAQTACQNLQPQIDATNTDLQQITQSLASATACYNQVKAQTNGSGTASSPLPVSPCVSNPNSSACTALGEQSCTNPAFAKKSTICLCAANPNGSSCMASKTAMQNAVDAAAKSGSDFGLKGSNIALDLGSGGGNNPADLVNKDGLGAGGKGTNPGGQKGGSPGTLSGGHGGGGGAGDSDGSGGVAGDDKTDILAGWRGSGGIDGMNNGAANADEVFPGDGPGNTVAANSPNLDEFRPDMAYDPKFNRGVVGTVGPDGIRGAYTNIFDNMNEAFRRQKYNFIYKSEVAKPK